MDVRATILRYFLSYVFASLATKYGIDAATQGHLVDTALTVVLGLATLGPLLFNLFTRPSSAAMKVAVEADKVMAGEKPTAKVQTPAGVPNITITRGGQG